MSKIISCCPVVAEEYMHLIPIDALPTQDPLGAAHKARVMWIQESESQVHMLHGRQVLKSGNRYNDLSGYLTSVEQAWREAHRLAEHYELSENSFQSIEVRVHIYRIPVIDPNESLTRLHWDKLHNNRQYELLTGRWCQLRLSRLQNQDVLLADSSAIVPLKQQVFAESQLAWTSKTGRKNPAESLLQFKQDWDFTARPRGRDYVDDWQRLVSNGAA